MPNQYVINNTSAFSSFPDTTTNSCNTQCPSGTFPNKDIGQCQICNSAVCKTCSTSPTTCATCNDNLLTYEGKCYKYNIMIFYIFFRTTECPTGTFGDAKNLVCTLCNADCATCTGPLNTECPTCGFNRYSISNIPNTCVTAD